MSWYLKLAHYQEISVSGQVEKLRALNVLKLSLDLFYYDGTQTSLIHKESYNFSS